eukprot:m.4121 g.4121  ORF g.4121 m.4121 type:complete len:1787 (+) comp10246_c0_seq1:161-5521(+)
MGALIYVAYVASLMAVLAQAQRGPNYLVSIPSVVQAGVEQKACVSVFKVNVAIPVRLDVLNSSGNSIFNVQQDISAGQPSCLSFKVPLDQIPSPDHNGNRFVFIQAASTHPTLRFSKRVKAALGEKSHSVFVQTDKPIYVRDDTVHIRFAVVRYDLLPLDSATTVIVDIKNPQDIIVDRFNLTSSSKNNPVIKKKEFVLGPSPVVGIWTIVVKHGLAFLSTSEFQFEVKNYVLPKFGVVIDPPRHVSLTDPHIKFGVEAKYTYGKPVVGRLTVRVGVWNETSQQAEVFKTISQYMDPRDKGTKELTIPNAGWLQAFPEGRRLYLYAEVKERVSGVNQSSSDISAFFTDTPIHLDCDLTPPFYKTNLPFLLTVRAKYSGGTPAARQSIEVTTHVNTKLEKLTDEDGNVNFNVDVGDVSRSISITAEVRDQNVGKVCSFNAFPVPSCGGSIVVRPKESGTLTTGALADFEMVKTNNNLQIPITAVLTSCGVIRQTKSFTSKSGPVTAFQMEISEDVCSKISVLVYYINTCDHVVADLVTVDVERRCPNDVSLEINARSNTVKPGEEAEIIIRAAPHSDVALLAVDSGLYILNNENKLTKNQLFDDLLEYDKSCGYTAFNAKGLFDAAGLTTISGTSTAVTERESDKCTSRKRREAPVQESSCMCQFGRTVQAKALTFKQTLDLCADERRKFVEGRSTSTCDVTDESLREFRHCCDSEEYVVAMKQRGRSNNEDIIEPEVFDDKFVSKRSFFPHAWLWSDTTNMGDAAMITKTVTVPDSITEWVIQGLAFSKEKGFCAAEPKKLRVFKPLFVECHSPFSFQRQEQISLSCSAYNYQATPARVGMRIVNPSEEICTSAGSGDKSPLIRFTIPPNGAVNQLFPIVPLNVGKQSLSVQLLTQLGGDEIKQELRVVPEGIFDEYDYSAELDPQGVNVEGGPKCTIAAPNLDFRVGECYQSVTNDPNTDSPICGDALPGNYTKTNCCDGELPSHSVAWSWSKGQQCEVCPRKQENFECNVAGAAGGKRQVNKFYVRVPEDYVPGSVTAWLSVTGKYFEGTLVIVEGIEGLLRQPGGCGEQSMIRFGPNVAIAKNLQATGQLVGGKREQVLGFIKRGYQYQLRYRVPNGAFTVWRGNQAAAATWLSSFVLQTMCEAKELVFVDPDVLLGLQDFLSKNRQHADGQFYEGARVYHAEMVGGIQGGDSSMTAYVMISILQCCSPPGNEGIPQAARTAVCKGVDYLESQINANQIVRPYTRAIVYLALLRACEKCQVCQCNAGLVTRARKLLDEKAVVNDEGAKYWPVDSQRGNAYWYKRRPEAISVETTAYALCGYVAAGDSAKAGPIAKWLNSVRNSGGAFVSTQDTVVALKCLAEYSVYVKQDRSLKISVTAKHDSNFSGIFSIEKSNSDLNQRVEIPVNDIIKVETTGNGLGLTQVHVEYNVLQSQAEQCRFDFTVEARLENPNINGIDDKFVLLDVCAQYLGSNETSMAMVEIDLPTGYVTCEEGQDHCLKELNENEGQKIQLGSYEVRGRGPAFYFDTISHEKKTCFKFRANRQYAVENILPVSARVYDYYEPDEKCNIFYALNGDSAELPVDCSTRAGKKEPICICGAGRCPILQEIENRLCQACMHHDYVYAVKVLEIVNENGWQKVRSLVLDVLKPGKRGNVGKGDVVYFWMALTCARDVELKTGGKYQVMGQDGPKFVLDHHALVEEYKETKAECLERKLRKCSDPPKGYNKPCDSQKRPTVRNACKKKLKKCKKQKREQCEKDVDKDFDTYVSNLKEGAVCDQNPCQQ